VEIVSAYIGETFISKKVEIVDINDKDICVRSQRPELADMAIPREDLKRFHEQWISIHR
jgi:hypothetical protein